MVEPKKYYCENLKVVLMFDITDPYKLVLVTNKYKMNEYVDSYCYRNIKDIYDVQQIYYSDEQKNIHDGLCQYMYDNGDIASEGRFINGKREGLWQYWYKNRTLSVEGHYVNDKQNGLWQLYHSNGEKNFEEYFVDGHVTCASNSTKM
jgi:antitoxin component YwqK of YwqJK toxin-antitoxin module